MGQKDLIAIILNAHSTYDVERARSLLSREWLLIHPGDDAVRAAYTKLEFREANHALDQPAQSAPPVEAVPVESTDRYILTQSDVIDLIMSAKTQEEMRRSL